MDAMIRETAEEAGLLVVPESIQEYGYVHRIQKSDHHGAVIFIQDNFYYLCDVKRAACEQFLDDYEAEARFTLKWVDPLTSIDTNRNRDHGPTEQTMLEREARVLEMLKSEAYFK